MIQDAPLVAVHAHPAIALTATEPDAAAADTDVAPGEMVKVQPPACTIVNVCPAMLNEPVRCVEDALAVTE